MRIDIEDSYDKLYRYCYFKLHNRELAEDVTQETILRFLECDNYRDTGRPLAFLYTVARNLCTDQFRKKQTEPLNEEITEAGFEDKVIENIALHEAIQSLEKEERELLFLRYVNEVPFTTLGELYGKSRFALYRDLNRITSKLERRMSDESEYKETT